MEAGRGEKGGGGGGTVFAGIQKLCNGITEQETIPVSHSRILLPWNVLYQSVTGLVLP